MSKKEESSLESSSDFEAEIPEDGGLGQKNQSYPGNLPVVNANFNCPECGFEQTLQRTEMLSRRGKKVI